MFEAQLQRCQLLLQQGRFDMAEQAARQVLVEHPTLAIGSAMLALSLLGQERFAEARESADTAVAFGPDEPSVHEVRARVLLVCNRPREAEAAAREAVRLDPEEPVAYGVLAQALAARSQWSAALEMVEQGLGLDAEDPDLLNLRTYLLVQAGRRAVLGAATDDALRAAPNDSDSHASVGWAKLNQRDYDGAFRHFREALRLNPESEFARTGVLEAIRARNWLYALMLRYFLWVGRMGSKGLLWAVGLYVAVQVLIRSRSAMPEWLQYAVLALVLIYVLFCVSTWVARPLFDLLLRFHPFGRLVLSRQQRWDATILAALLLAGISTLVAALVVDSGKTLLAGTQAIGVAVLFAASTTHAGKRRWLMTGIVAVAAVLLTHFCVTVPDTVAGLREHSMQFFAYTVLAGLIAGNVLAATPERR